MSFLQSTLPGGAVNVRCRGCGLVARFLARDTAAISHWRRVHVCQPAPLTTTTEAAA